MVHGQNMATLWAIQWPIQQAQFGVANNLLQ